MRYLKKLRGTAAMVNPPVWFEKIATFALTTKMELVGVARMPKAKQKKPRTLDFDEYLARLMQLKGAALQQWNRESTRRSNMLQREFSEASKENIDRFLETPDAEASLIEQKNHSGAITRKLGHPHGNE